MQTQQQQTAPLGISSTAAEPQLLAIGPEHLAALLEAQPVVLERLDGIVTKSNGRFSVHGILDKFARKVWVLWIVWDGTVRAVIATSVYENLSDQRCCMIEFVTGQGAASWTHLLSKIEDYASAEGCVRVEMIARKGWARHLPDYKMSYVLMEKDLVNG